MIVYLDEFVVKMFSYPFFIETSNHYYVLHHYISFYLTSKGATNVLHSFGGLVQNAYITKWKKIENSISTQSV